MTDDDKPRECWTADGRPKRRFSTRRAAKQHLRDVSKITPTMVENRPYRCSCCGWFHVGHYPSSPRVRADRRARHREGGASQ